MHCPNCEQEILFEDRCCGFYNDGTNLISTKDIIPKVGMGVTHQLGSDAYSYTITEVITERKVKIAMDKKIPYHRDIFSDNQEYDHIKGSGDSIMITKRKNGHWYQKGDSMCSWQAFFLGIRRSYTDPHF